jgi:hypothetical protein
MKILVKALRGIVFARFEDKLSQEGRYITDLSHAQFLDRNGRPFILNEQDDHDIAAVEWLNNPNINENNYLVKTGWIRIIIFIYPKYIFHAGNGFTSAQKKLLLKHIMFHEIKELQVEMQNNHDFDSEKYATEQEMERSFRTYLNNTPTIASLKENP